MLYSIFNSIACSCRERVHWHMQGEGSLQPWSSSYWQRVTGYQSVEGWEAFSSTPSRSWTFDVWQQYCSGVAVGHLLVQILHISFHSSLAAFKTCWVDWWQHEHRTADSCHASSKVDGGGTQSDLSQQQCVNGDEGHLITFTTLQWESELYNGRSKACGYPFDLDGHHFQGKNPQVGVKM